MTRHTDMNTPATPTKDFSSSREERIRHSMERWEKYKNSPEAKRRREWRALQWEALEKEGLRPEEIAEEILPY